MLLRVSVEYRQAYLGHYCYVVVVTKGVAEYCDYVSDEAKVAESVKQGINRVNLILEKHNAKV